MGSLIPFPDLNLYPDPIYSYASASTSTSNAVTAPLVPKIEPKLEPLDESLESDSDYLQSPIFPNGNPFSSYNSRLPVPNFDANAESQAPLARVAGGAPDDSSVSTEFDRIIDLFQSVVSKDGQLLGEAEALDPNSGAIVPVPEDNRLSTVVVSSQHRRKKRSSELVRILDLGPADHRHYREVVRKTRLTFDSLRVLIVSQGEKRLPGERKPRGDLHASTLMKKHDLWLNRDKRIVGAIPGIYVGDLFFFRMELCVVGLHGQTQAGIDYVPSSQSSNREPIATSVIVSGGYEDDEDGGDTIIYTGHGGQDKHSRQQCVHQKLEGGNLALERSMHYGIEVRVIRGFKYEGSYSGKVYVYDGLYKITETWFDVGRSGFGVYKFKLVRMDYQPEMGSAVLRFAQNLRLRPLTVRPSGYVSFDISLKKEKIPVYLFNDIDNDNEPVYYDYITSSVFPPYVRHQGVNSGGCGCISGCSDVGDCPCPCASRNGGEFAYDYHGILVRGKPLIFECGTNCSCPPSCPNRVTQKGVTHRFEVFRSRETNWGVRSLDLIQAGAFICEYAGVVLTREQVQIFTMNGDNLIHPSRFAERWSEWGNLSSVFSDYTPAAYPSIPPLDFALDVSRMRNVACYMSHSTNPNALVQLVLYDHNNLLFPHLMLFAMENIPPLKEISLDYGVLDEWMGKLPICN